MKSLMAALAFLGVLAAPIGTRGAEKNDSHLLRLADSDLRLAKIGFRLATASRARCSALMPATGLVLHSLSQYGSVGRSAAAQQWSFPSPVSVEAVVPGSPADRAGLQPGDGLGAIAGRPMADAAAAGTHASLLRDEAELFIQSLDPAKPILFGIRRGERSLQLELIPVPACRSRFELVEGHAIKARSDGSVIQIGQAFAERLSEGNLAVAVAHELAHTILGHRAQLSALERDRPNRAGRKALALKFEDDADMLSLALLRDAGWDPALAPRFMRTEGRRYDPFVSGTGLHRSAEERARRMEQAIDTIKTRP